MPRTRAIVCSMLAASMATAAVGAGVAFAAGGNGTKANPIQAKTSTTLGFNAKTVTVKPGTIVYFKNTDGAPHNAASTKKANGKPAFYSGAVTTGNFKAKAPTTPGTYAYICQQHPFMKGTLIVKK